MEKQKVQMFRALSLIVVGAATSLSTLANDLVVADGWVRETPPGRSMTAAYGTLKNVGDEVLVILGVNAEIAAHSSLHETRIERDRSTMRPVSNLAIAPGEDVKLAPGGMHIMLMKLDAPLLEGESIDICFELENNSKACHSVPVSKRKASGHRH